MVQGQICALYKAHDLCSVGSCDGLFFQSQSYEGTFCIFQSSSITITYNKMPFNHVALNISPAAYQKTRDFYVAALKPLGYTIKFEREGNIGFDAGAGLDFLLFRGPDDVPGGAAQPQAVNRTHLAFAANSTEQVGEFYRAMV